jgi:hypothetical protein
MWESIEEPGKRSPSHTLRDNYRLYDFGGSTVALFDAEGRSLGSFEARSDDRFSLKLNGAEFVSDDDQRLGVSATRDLGSGRYRGIPVGQK